MADAPWFEDGQLTAYGQHEALDMAKTEAAQGKNNCPTCQYHSPEDQKQAAQALKYGAMAGLLLLPGVGEGIDAGIIGTDAAADGLIGATDLGAAATDTAAVTTDAAAVTTDATTAATDTTDIWGTSAAEADPWMTGATDAAAPVDPPMGWQGMADSTDGTLFRGDSRTMGDIFENGFQPQAPGSSTDLYTYATQGGPSNFVSTSTSPSIASAYSGGTNSFYTIEPMANGIDVGTVYPANPLQEVAVPGGIPPTSVRGFTDMSLDNPTTTLNPNYVPK